MLGLAAVVVVVVVDVVVVVVGAGSPVSRNLAAPGSSVMLVTRSLLRTALTVCTRSDPSLNVGQCEGFRRRYIYTEVVCQTSLPRLISAQQSTCTQRGGWRCRRCPPATSAPRP